MSKKQIIILLLGTIFGWFVAKEILWSTIGGFYGGGLAGREASNQAMKDTLVTVFFIGALMNTIRSAEILDIWKNEYTSSILKGTGIGIILFKMIYYSPIAMISMIFLYAAVLGAGYGVGRISGYFLKMILPNTWLNRLD